MFDHHIEILRYEQVRDAYNDRSKVLTHVATCYAQRTESGGKENIYAGRIVHENEVVYSIRYRKGISAGMVVLDEGRRLRITATQEEGRRWRLHIRATKTDSGESHVED
ncbi:MAG: phage head closure protein [Bacteroidales bacterium]|jgi:SPP1 family predicted phage head-tail adaptor|nr:phage head closure protein [Bacteroidales bacterium]